MGNIEHVYSKVAILENNGYVVGAVHINGKPENEYAPLEWCNDEDILDVDKFGVITVEQYEKAGYKFPAPTDERVQWFGIEDITKDKFDDRHDRQAEDAEAASEAEAEYITGHLVNLFNLLTIPEVVDEKEVYAYNLDADDNVELLGLIRAAKSDVDWLMHHIGIDGSDDCDCECCGACGQMSFVDEYIARKSAMVEKVEALAKKAGKAEEEFADWVDSAVKDITEDDVDALVASKNEAIEERDKVLVHALYEVKHSSDDDRLRNMLGVFLDAALGTGKHKPSK